MGKTKTNLFWGRAHGLGLFLAALFVICFVWFFLNSTERELHEKLFRLSYLGFSEMNLQGFLLGIIQTYLWAYIVLGVWKLTGQRIFSKDTNKYQHENCC